MNSDTNTNNNMSNIGSDNHNNHNINSNRSNKLSSLYDHALGSILHNDNIFETNDTLLNNGHNDVLISKTPMINTATNVSNSNTSTTTTDTYSQQDTANLVDISSSGGNNSSEINSDGSNVLHSVNLKKNGTSRSNSNSVITDNASSGTIEDIINPAFMKPTVLNNSNNNNRKGTLMLARDAKADIRNIMRMGSPLSIFNSEHVSNNDLNDFYDNKRRSNNSNLNTRSNTNDSTSHINRNAAPLYSTDIIKNSIISSNNDFSNTTHNNSNNSNNNNNLINISSNQIHPNGPTHRRHNQHKTRPAFINKLWNMVNDENNKELIQWADDGQSFIVKNREVFVHNILPRYFKHSNFASFVRQLNMYGWHKVQDIRSGSIQGSSDDKWQFANENFIRGREDLLVNIVRQRGSSHTHNHNQSHYNNTAINHNGNNDRTRSGFMNGNFNTIQISGNTYPNYNINQKLLQNIQNDQSNGASNNLLRGSNLQQPENLNPRATLHITNGPESIPLQNSIGAVLNELEQIKYNQIAISKDLIRINKDNELLWKENMIARERYRSQQQILEKIFRFMAAMMPHLDQKMIMDGLADKDKGQYNVTNNNNNINGTDLNLNGINNNVNNANSNNKSNSNNAFNEIKSSNSNLGDSSKLVVNDLVNYGRNNEINPQIITPSENGSKHNAVYMESLEDVDNSPPEPITSTRNVINFRQNDNNSKRNDRLLLKNTVTYPNSNDISNKDNIALKGQPYNTIYPNAMPNIYSNNDINHSSHRISELPVDDGGLENNIPIIQEINSNTTSPQTTARDGNTANINMVNGGSNSNNNNNSIFNRLQDNIREQDNRIRHLEDMVTHLTPKVMSPMTMLDSHDPEYNRADNYQNVSNPNNLGNTVRLPQDYYASQNNDPMPSNFNQNNTGSNKTDTFNLQDYLTHESPSHQEAIEDMSPLPLQPPILGGMSPLMMEDSQFLLNGEDSSHINPVVEMEQPVLQPPQIEELSDASISHIKKRRIASSVSNSGMLKKQRK